MGSDAIFELNFLIPGVVSPSLSPTFAIPAAYVDLVAGYPSGHRDIGARRWSIPIVWVFNVFGAIDLLYAFF